MNQIQMMSTHNVTVDRTGYMQIDNASIIHSEGSPLYGWKESVFSTINLTFDDRVGYDWEPGIERLLLQHEEAWRRLADL